jgi:transcriptional antiterminator NusG
MLKSKLKNEGMDTPEADPKKTNWYTLRVQSGRERTLLERMNRDKERGDLPIIEAFYPTEKTITNRNGQRIMREKVLFPGYIFVETKYVGELEYWVKSTPGAAGLLKDAAGNPIWVKQYELEKMRAKGDETDTAMVLEYSSGERVRILGGPFSGFEGDVKEMNRQKNSVKVSVKIFGRENFIEIPLDDVERVNN